MTYENNPFRILMASTEDSIERLNELADSCALYSDASACYAARDVLADPKRRLAAEINWFPGCSRTETARICRYIDAARKGREQEPLPMDWFSPLTRFNIKLACLEGKKPLTAQQCRDMVLDIASAYDEASPEVIEDEIIESRKASGFSTEIDMGDIYSNIELLRERAEVELERKTPGLSVEDFFDLAVMLADARDNDEKYNRNVIVRDLACWMGKALQYLGEEVAKNILQSSVEITASESSDDVGKAAEDLISDLKNLKTVIDWQKEHPAVTADVYAPGQDLYQSVRAAYLKLEQSFGLGEQAEKTAGGLTELFADDQACAEQIGSDIAGLRGGKEEHKQAEKRVYSDPVEDNWNSRPPEDGTEFDVKLKGNGFYVPKYCMKCLEPTDKRILYPGGFKLPVCEKCQKEAADIRAARRNRRAALKMKSEEKAKKIVLMSLIPTVIIGAIAALVVYLTSGSAVWTAAALAAGAILCMLIFSNLRVKCTDLGYCLYDSPDTNGFAKVRKVMGGVAFTFYNDIYAQWFAERNDSEVTARETDAKKTDDTEYMKSAARVYGNTWMVYAAVVIAAAIICAVLWSCMTFEKKTEEQTPIVTATVSELTNTSEKDTEDTPEPMPAAVPAPEPEPESATAPEAEPTPEPEPRPGNGYVFFSNRDISNCVFKLENNTNYDYYMKFVEVDTGEDVIAFYSRAKSNISVNVPIGNFELRYAAGKEWYGEELLFGEFTVYSRDEEPYPYDSDWLVWEVRFNSLNTVDMDKMYVESITAEEF